MSDDKTTQVKKCATCGEELPVADFSLRRERRSGQGRKDSCKQCLNAKAYAKRDASAARTSTVVRRREPVAQVRARTQRFLDRRVADIRALVATAKSKPCADCGVSYPPYVMDFDHRPGTGKSFQISSSVVGGRSLATVQAEIDKCDLVCSNCHRERTFGRIREAPKIEKVRVRKPPVPLTAARPARWTHDDVRVVERTIAEMQIGSGLEDLVDGKVLVLAGGRGRSGKLVGARRLYSKALLKAVRLVVHDMSLLALNACLAELGWRRRMVGIEGVQITTWEHAP